MMKWIKRLFLLLILSVVLGVAGVAAIFFYLKADLPDVTSIKNIPLQVPMKVFSRDGELISQFGEKRRIPLVREQIPDQLANAFIATEDSRFYQHIGMDPIGIARAATVWISSGSARQGASTITQQVARNFFLTNERTIIRKIREIFIAMQIEQILTKDEILMLYLNKISLGHRSYGVGAAAQVYFGKTVDELTLSEMAVLGGLPKAPSRLNPIYSVARATERRNIVLMRMLSENYITQEEYEQAKAEEVVSRYHGAEITLSAHYVAEIARNKLIELYGEDRSYNEGFNVYTTITKTAQEAANKAVINNLHDYDKRHGYRGPAKVLWTENETPWSIDKIREALSEEASFADLSPAVVVAVHDQSIDVIAKGLQGQISTIEWDGLKWARPFKTDSTQGDAPTNAHEIVKVGEQIWTTGIEVKEEIEVPIELEEDDSIDLTVDEIADDLPIDELAETETKIVSVKKLQLSQYPMATSAFVSLDSQDGAITSLVGGFSFVQSKFNRATQAKRQVGSNIKPFIYSAALDNGYTLATLVNDTPINQWTGSAAWRPKNSPEIYEGPIRLRRALGQSKNVVSVRLVQDLGIRKVIDQLTKFGFSKSDMPTNFSIALGSASITPLELATGYAIIANGGYKVEPYVIERIENAYGTVLYQAQPMTVCPECAEMYKEIKKNDDLTAYKTIIDGGREVCAIAPISEVQVAIPAISAETAFLTRELLRTAVWGGGSWKHQTGWNGTGWRAARAIQRQDMGGKTGTTNDSKDAWFSGYVGQMVATSWVGFDDFERTLGEVSSNENLEKDQVTGGEFGARTALPAWTDFMQATMADQPTFQPPQPITISTARIDRATGLLSSATDHTTLFEFFKTGTTPTEYVPKSNYTNPQTNASDSEHGGIEGTSNQSSPNNYDTELF
jgi:penicillin-binding protein 1A